jgi:hypothetical protein
LSAVEDPQRIRERRGIWNEHTGSDGGQIVAGHVGEDEIQTRAG